MGNNIVYNKKIIFDKKMKLLSTFMAFVAALPAYGAPLGDSCMKVCSGNLEGRTKWIEYNGDGMYADIDISHCRYIETPAIVTSMGGTSGHWIALGTSSVYDASPRNFRIYIKTDYRHRRGSNNYHLNYIAHGKVCLNILN